MRIHRNVPAGARSSVDHFVPKTVDPTLAYEWNNNYRLASGRVNSCKGNQTNILDPFLVDSDWFEMDIPSCRALKAKSGVAGDLRRQINATINSLRLNGDDYYVQERCNILIGFPPLRTAFQNRFGFVEI